MCRAAVIPCHDPMCVFIHTLGEGVKPICVKFNTFSERYLASIFSTALGSFSSTIPCAPRPLDHNIQLHVVDRNPSRFNLAHFL